MLVSVGEQTSTAPAYSWRKAPSSLCTFMSSCYWWWHPSVVFSAVCVCHQAPDALCSVLIKLPTLVYRPTRNSPWLFAANQTITNPFLPSWGDAYQSVTHIDLACIRQGVCPWNETAGSTELLVNSVQSVSEIDFNPCRINISFFSWGLWTYEDIQVPFC